MHLKINKHLGTVYQSTEPRPIKVANTASSDSKRANKIAIETAKTGKVTAVVAIVTLFVKKDAICRALLLRTRSLLAKRRKAPNSRRTIPSDRETFL